MIIDMTGFKYGVRNFFNRKREKKLQWHKWFAWYPVLLETGEYVKSRFHYAWLETVERKYTEEYEACQFVGIVNLSRWEYREAKNQKLLRELKYERREESRKQSDIE